MWEYADNPKRVFDSLRYWDINIYFSYNKMPINVFMDFYTKFPPRFFNKNKSFIGKIENKQTTTDKIYIAQYKT